MASAKNPLKYVLLVSLALVLGASAYVAGKTPRVIKRVLVEVTHELQRKHGIRVQLDRISVQGFLTIGVDGFLLEKKDIHLLIKANSIKAKLSPWRYFVDGNPVSRLEIDTPQVTATIDTQGPEKELPRLNFSLNELVLKNGQAEIRWNNRIIHVAKLDANARLTPKWVDIHAFSVETPEAKLIAEGQLRLGDPSFLGSGSKLRVWLSGSLQNIPELKRQRIPIEADIHVQGQVSYPSKERGWEFEGQTSATGIRIDDVHIHSLLGPIFANQKHLELRGIEAGFAGGKPKIKGVMNFDKGLHFRAQVSGAKLSLYELLSDLNVKDSWVDLELETNAQVKGQIFPEFGLKGSAVGQAVNLTVHEKKLLILATAHPIRFDMDLGANKHAFQFRNAKFDDGKSRLTADCDLFLDNRNGMWLEAKIDNFNFQSIQNKIAGEKYVGVGLAKASIRGAYEHLKIEAPAKFQYFEFNEFQFGQVTGDLAFENNRINIRNIKGQQHSLDYTGELSVSLGKKPVYVVLNASVKKGLAEDIRRFVFPSLKELELFGPIEGTLNLDGPLEEGYREKLTGKLDLKLLEHARFMGSSLQSGSLKIDVDAHTAKLMELKLDSDQGVATSVGEYDKVTKTGYGTLKLSNTQAGSGEFQLQVLDEQLKAEGALSDSGTLLKAQVDLKKSLPYEATVSMPYGPVRALLPKTAWLETYQVSAGIRAQARGNLSKLADSEISLELSPAVFYLGTLRLLAAQKVEAFYRNQKLILEPTIFKSVYNDKIDLSATASTAELDLNFKTTGDLWFLTHLDDRIEGAYGNLNSDIKVQGPWKRLIYFGHIDIAPGSYISLRDYPPGLTDLSGNVRLGGTDAELQLEGKAAQGRFDLNGRLNLREARFDELRVDLVKMPAYYSSFLSGTANGYLNLEGPFSEPLLFGDIKFSELLITKELDPSELKAPRSRAKKQAVKLDVALSSENPVRLLSKTFHGDLTGNVRLVGNSNSPGMLGELTVLSGEVYFRNNYYRIVKARANFDNPFRIVPMIDVEANSQILDYDVSIHAQGELTKPKLFYSSRPSLPQSDLISLITFGFTNKDNRDNLGVARTAGLEALSAYSGISDEVLKAMPSGTIDEFRLGTLYNQMGGGVTSSVVLGMQVSGGMRLRFQSALFQSASVQNSSGNRAKRLELERYIDRRWRWRLVWNSEGITNYGDAGADLWIRWDF